jgi:hypothetical protein
MPDVPHFNDPEHWQLRAEESRVMAEQMNDETAKQKCSGSRTITTNSLRERRHASGVGKSRSVMPFAGAGESTGAFFSLGATAVGK